MVYAGRGEGGPEVLTLVPRSYTRESGSVAQQIDHLRSEDGAQERFLQLGLANIQAVGCYQQTNLSGYGKVFQNRLRMPGISRSFSSVPGALLGKGNGKAP